MSKEDRVKNANTILRELNEFEETVKQVGDLEENLELSKFHCRGKDIYSSLFFLHVFKLFQCKDDRERFLLIISNTLIFRWRK